LDQHPIVVAPSETTALADKKEANRPVVPAGEASTAAAAPRKAFGPAALQGGSVPQNPEGKSSFQNRLAATARPQSAASNLLDAVGAFSQIRNGNAAASVLAQPNVLSNFELSRNGQSVRVTDADGSVYEGEVVETATDKLGEKDVAKFALTGQTASQNDENYAFKVAGTNRHLQQNVVFSGNVSNMPAPPVLNQQGFGRAQNQKMLQSQNQSQIRGQNQNRNQSQNAQTAQNVRITGKVQVGDSKPYEIEAQTPQQ
jgi:hypothetical protein